MIPVLAERAAGAERERRLPQATIADMQAAGFFRVLQPKRWGGFECDPATYFDIQLALSEGDMSTGWVFGVVGVHPWLMGLFDDGAAHDVWGSDDSALICSSLMPVGTVARAPGGFRLSGRWKFASGSDHCTWAVLGGTVIDENGTADRCIFLLPSSDYEIVDTWDVAGLRATGSQDIVVADAYVPEHRHLRLIDNFNGVGPGQAVNTSSLYRWLFGQIFPRGVSTAAIGALQAMFDAYVTYGKGRVSRGAKAIDDPVVQLVVADVAVALDEMKTMLFRDLSVMRDFAARGELPPFSLRLEYKFHCARVAEQCSVLASRLFKAAGGAALYTDLPFGRILADINAGRQHISNQYEVTGRAYGSAIFGVEHVRDLML